MVGASFALALRGTKLRVLLIESVPPDSAAQPSFDERTTALGNGSRQIFESLGVWPAMAAESAPIRSIHVSDAGPLRRRAARCAASRACTRSATWCRTASSAACCGRRCARRRTSTLAVPAQLKSATLRDDGVLLDVVIDGKTEKIRAAVAVAADGAGSVLRASAGIEAAVEDYDQVAIVVNAATERPNNGEAFERFTSSGPLAVLPVTGGGYAVVWAVTPGARRGAAWRSTKPRSPPSCWPRSAGAPAAGRASAAAIPIHSRCRAPPKPWPGASCSSAMPRRRCIRWRARVSTSGCAMRPRSRRCWRGAGIADSGLLGELLGKFAAWRAEDRSGVTRFTDGLVKLFGSDTPGVGLVRNFGLLLFDLSPAAKRALSRVSWGFAGRMPRLARGLPLE